MTAAATGFAFEYVRRVLVLPEVPLSGHFPQELTITGLIRGLEDRSLAALSGCAGPRFLLDDRRERICKNQVFRDMVRRRALGIIRCSTNVSQMLHQWKNNDLKQQAQIAAQEPNFVRPHPSGTPVGRRNLAPDLGDCVLL